MEQSPLAADQAPSPSQIFNLSSPTFAIRLSATQQPSLPPSVQVVAPSLTVSGFPGISFSTTMSQAAALGAVPTTVRFQTNPTHSPDPPAAGPSVASMPATTRLRAAVLSARGNAAAAVAAAASPTPPITRRSARVRRGGSAADGTSVDPPLRTQRTRKRAPTAASRSSASEEARDPPTKKQRRANLKSAPPANAKSDDDDKEEGETKTASCCICMDEPKPADLASINGCDHLFCFDCIEKWAERENTCPLCKVRFTKIDRVNKTKRKKGEASKNTKKVKQKDQRSDIAPGAALEGLLASFASSANFPPHRMARLIFSGMGSNPFAAVLPGAAALRSSRAAAAAGAAAAERANADEDNLFSSDDDDEEQSFLPAGAPPSFTDLFRAMPRGPGIIVGGSLGGPHRGISLTTFDPPPGRSYASNSADRNAGRQAENPLEIEDDSEDEEDIEVVQVTRPV